MEHYANRLREIEDEIAEIEEAQLALAHSGNSYCDDLTSEALRQLQEQRVLLIWARFGDPKTGRTSSHESGPLQDSHGIVAGDPDDFPEPGMEPRG